MIFDLDGDGDLDIVTNEFNSAPQVLDQRPGATTADPLAQGRACRGRRRTATASAPPCACTPAGAIYTKCNDGKSGYLSQSALPLYFGLGDAERIDSVEVTWPSGRKQVVTKGLDINRTLRVAEPPQG